MGAVCPIEYPQRGSTGEGFWCPRQDCQKNILGETLRQVPKLKLHLMGVN